jgi:hypothetical protein
MYIVQCVHNDNEVIDLLYIYQYSMYVAKQYNSFNYIQILLVRKYLDSTKSCDILQLKNVNHHQHSPIGH